MLKFDPSKIKTFLGLLVFLAFIVYSLSDKMIEKGLFTKDTVNDLLIFLFFVIIVLCFVWVFNNISEKEIVAEAKSKTNSNRVTKSTGVDITNKSIGNGIQRPGKRRFRKDVISMPMND